MAAEEPVVEIGLNGLNDPRILGHTLPQGLRFGPEKPSGEVAKNPKPARKRNATLLLHMHRYQCADGTVVNPTVKPVNMKDVNGASTDQTESCEADSDWCSATSDEEMFDVDEVEDLKDETMDQTVGTAMPETEKKKEKEHEHAEHEPEAEPSEELFAKFQVAFRKLFCCARR